MQTAVAVLQDQLIHCAICGSTWFAFSSTICSSPLSTASYISSTKQKNVLSCASKQLCSLWRVWAVPVCSILENVCSLEEVTC